MEKQKLLILLAVAMGGILTASAAMAVEPVLYFNASVPASGVDSASWNSLTANSSFDWTFSGTDVTLVDVTSAVPSITKAYRFTGGAGSDIASPWRNAIQTTNPDATWELWLKPADTGALDNQIIFETGAVVWGAEIYYTVGTPSDNTGYINFKITRGDTDTVSAPIDTTEFSHIVCDFDHDYDGSKDRLRIFVDGVLAADNAATAPTGIVSWFGANQARLGSHSYVPAGTPANSFEGDLAVLRFWQFTTPITDAQVLKSFVGAGDDMVAWDGAAVQLNPTINSTLTSYWTADLPSGVQAVFNPDIYAVDPVVTFTKASYSNATIINASFEDPALGEGLMTANNNVPGWVAKNASVYDPNTPLYGGIAPDGDNVVRVNNTYDGTDKYVYQVVNETLQAGATYTLNVSLGVDYVTGTADPNSTDPNSTDYKVELLAGTDYDNAQLLAGEVGHYSDINNYKDISVAYTYNEADAALVGEPLQIRLTCVYGTNGSERGAIFDNVELTSSPDFPAPEVATAGLTLTVQDDTNPAVSDSLTVDIYDDACAATLGEFNVDAALTDLNGDCITDLQDLAALAMDWLVDHAVDTPQPKP